MTGRAVRALVTGSSGHLGEALMRALRAARIPVTGLDLQPSAWTDVTASITDVDTVRRCMQDVEVVYHTATLHKPHVATHSKQQFVDTNVTGTLTLLEAAVAAGVRAFVFTSTTSVFGDALRPPDDRPAAWVTEDVRPLPRNIYGVTKSAAEDLCHLFHRRHGLACVVLRTSRFFPEDDDDAATRAAYTGDNAKTNEFLFRRVDIEDAVTAHLRAAERATALGFGCYIVSATTPFRRRDTTTLRTRVADILRDRVPEFEPTYTSLGWRMFPGIDRVYVNDAARADLGWAPKFDFRHVLARIADGAGPLSELAASIGLKGYHDQVFDDGPYPVE